MEKNSDCKNAELICSFIACMPFLLLVLYLFYSQFKHGQKCKQETSNDISAKQEITNIVNSSNDISATLVQQSFQWKIDNFMQCDFGQHGLRKFLYSNYIGFPVKEKTGFWSKPVTSPPPEDSSAPFFFLKLYPRGKLESDDKWISLYLCCFMKSKLWHASCGPQILIGFSCSLINQQGVVCYEKGKWVLFCLSFFCCLLQSLAYRAVMLP